MVWSEQKNMSTQKKGNLYVCSTEMSKSKSVHVNENESKRLNASACSTDETESKSVHEMNISVNKKKVKDTKDEEPLVYS